MQRIGFFPLNYGWEDYPLFKAMTMGYRIRCFEEIVTSETTPHQTFSKKAILLGKRHESIGIRPFLFSWEMRHNVF